MNAVAGAIVFHAGAVSFAFKASFSTGASDGPTDRWCNCGHSRRHCC